MNNYRYLISLSSSLLLLVFLYLLISATSGFVAYVVFINTSYIDFAVVALIVTMKCTAIVTFPVILDSYRTYKHLTKVEHEQ